MDLRFTLIGLLIGFLIGLTGMGGGSLMTPVMILVMGVKPLIAVGTDLAYGAVTKIVGAGVHLRQGTVNRRTGYLLGLGSVPATILGVGVTTAIRKSDPAFVNGFVLRSIAWVLIFVAVIMIARPVLAPYLQRLGTRLGGGDPRDGIQALGDTRPWLLPVIGAFVGFIVGLTSVGAGTLVIASLLFLYPRWQSRDLVGTDVFHGAILGCGATLAQFGAGNVNVMMTVSLLLGSLPGVLLGSRLAFGFPEGIVRFSLASVLLISGAKLL